MRCLTVGSRRVFDLLPAAAASLLVAAPFFAAPAFAGDGPPSEPYSVYITQAGEADPDLEGRLSNAVAALAVRLAEHRDWYRLTDDSDEAAIRISVFHAEASAGQISHVGSAVGFTPNRVFDARGSDYASLEAVVRTDSHRSRISGAGTGGTETASLRNAISDFIRKLQEFTDEAFRSPGTFP